MILTEEEAKKKGCQETLGSIPATCGGSNCMAWRWKRGSFYKAIPEKDKLPKNHPNYADFIKYEGKGEYSATHGYCGKAGRP